jgi:putative ABC transport system permease protein
MSSVLKIAARNLLRYRRRTLFTVSLITIGVVFVLVYSAASEAFKGMIIGQITDSMLGHIEVHRKGYTASIDNLPLNMNMGAKAYQRLEAALSQVPEIESASPRIKFGGMFSNFTETTSIRLNAVIPEREFKTVPLLPTRITEGARELKPGTILIPGILVRGMKVKLGDTVVIVATNKDGSVNGRQFVVSGILDEVVGPGGRDGYITFDDGRELLRMEETEISEVAIRLKDFGTMNKVAARLDALLAEEVNKEGKPIFEVHTWEKLSPFFNIARMVDVMSFFIKVMLIAIVLISITNTMITAVYERIREIGTMAAIGTLPGRIRSLFVIEGLGLGILGALSGSVLGALIIQVLRMMRLTFSFGRQTGLLLSPQVQLGEMATISIIVVVVAVIASVQPAVKASRMEPITALRHL